MTAVPGRLPHPATARSTRIFLWVFGSMMVLTAGTAFVFKLCEFFAIAVSQGSDALASFLIPVLNYLLVALGFACLLGWAYLRGEFEDVEATKYRMLEMQERIDRSEAAIRARARHG